MTGSNWFGGAIFLIGFVVSTLILQFLDVYGNAFYDVGPVYTAYHILRLVQSLYFLAFAWSLGFICSRIFKFRSFSSSLPPAQRIFVLSVIGIGVVNVLVFILGHLHQISYGLVLLLSIIVFYISWRDICKLSRESRAAFGVVVNEYGRFERLLVLVSFGAISIIIVVFILQILPPTLDWDVIHHYQKHLLLVVENGGFSNSTYWYHHFLSDGQGVQVWNAVLGDQYSFPIISLGVFIVSSLAMFSHARSRTGNSLLGVLVLLFVYAAFAPFSGLDRSGFDKFHMLNGIFVLCVFFLSERTIQLKGNSENKGLWCLSLVACFSLFASPPIAAVVLPILAVHYCLMSFNSRQCRLLGLLPLFFAITGLIVRLGANFFIYGLAEITPQGIWWKLSDVSELSSLVSPYLIATLIMGSLHELTPIANFWDFFLGQDKDGGVLELARLNHTLSQIIVGVVLVVVLAERVSRSNSSKMFEYRTERIFVTSVLVVLLFIAPLLGQTGSVIRAYIFFPLLMAMSIPYLFSSTQGVSTFTEFRKDRGTVGLDSSLSTIIVTVVTLFSLVVLSVGPLQNAPSRIAFLRNQSSFQEHYVNSSRSIPKMDRSELELILGSDTRAWSFTLRTIGLLTGPGIHIESFMSSRMSKEWHVIVFGEPSVARRLLEEAGIDFFFFDTEEPLEGLLPFSSLFSPERLSQELAVAARWGSVFLLTWRDSTLETVPIPIEVTRFWSDQVENSAFNRLHSEMQEIYGEIGTDFDRLKNHSFEYQSVF